MKNKKAPTSKPKPKPKPKLKVLPQASPPKIIIRNAQPPMAIRASSSGPPSIGECARANGLAIGAGAVATVIGGTAVYKGWIGPKLTAGLMLGSGIAAAVAGHYMESENLSSLGIAGLIPFGTALMAASIAIEGNEYVEKKQAEKRERIAQALAQAEREKRIDEARELLAEEARKGKPRNDARRVVIIDDDGNPEEIYEPEWLS